MATMPTIALKDEAKMLSGFLLISGNGPLAATPSRDCLFMVPPLPFSSSAKDLLATLKQREFSVTITTDGTAFQLRGACGPNETLELSVVASGADDWKINRNEKAIISGQCELAKGK